MGRLKYFTPREISLHITMDDLWVSLFGKVLDLSPICKDMIGDEKEIFVLLAFAGKDISHLFDEFEKVKLHVNPNLNEIDTFQPFQPFLDAPSQEESEKLFLQRRTLDEKNSEALMQKYKNQRLGLNHDYSETSTFPVDKEPTTDIETLPWWKDDQYVIGLLTQKSRWINIMNTMIMREVTLEVCCEETIEDILERYIPFNRHARSYTWKYLGEALVMKQTLEMNGIPDQDEDISQMKLNSDDFIATLTLYFNDDLTEM